MRNEFLHGQKAPVDSITGMDCSADGVRKAEKRVTSALADHLQNQQLTEDTCTEKMEDIYAPVGSLPYAKVQVVQGNIIDKVDPGSSLLPYVHTFRRRCLHWINIRFLLHTLKGAWFAGSWGNLHGVDMAFMIEVVEHLDVDVLECELSSSLLFALQQADNKKLLACSTSMWLFLCVSP